MRSVEGGNQVCYAQACIHVPVELKQRAKEAGINMSATFRDALEEKLAETENKNHPAQTQQDQNGGAASHRGAV